MLNKKGMSHVQTAVIVLILAMILSVVLSYASMMAVLKTTRENTELALDSFVTQNSVYIYDSLKNGNDFTDILNKEIFLKQIISVYRLDISGNMIYSTDEDENLIYRMTVPNVDFEYENTLNLRVDYTVTIPVTFAGRHITDLTIQQKVTSRYNLK
jgi:hypothetical protein